MSPLRRLRESVFSRFHPVKEAASVDSKPLGTPVAEYSEQGPFHCEDCKFVILRKGDRGLCNESHMKKDPKVRKNSKGFAIVNLPHGCCRFVKPPQGAGNGDHS